MLKRTQALIASILASVNRTANNSIANQLTQPTSGTSGSNRKGGRKQAHRFSGVAAQRRAAKKLRNYHK